MVKIAIIDSGIEYNKLVFEQYVINGIGITKNENENISINTNYIDENGHGTLCASVIYKECPQAELFVMKIFQKELCVDIDILERALEYLLHIDVHIINMSISVTSMDNGASRIKKLCKKLEQQGKVLVCAVTNDKMKSKPASYRSIIGVRGYILGINNDFWFSQIKRINCIVDDMPYLHYQGNGEYILFGMCNSYATAKISGMVASIISENPNASIKYIKGILSKNTSHKVWTENKIRDSKRYPLFQDKEINYKSSEMKKLERILQEFFGIEKKKDLYIYALYSEKIGSGKWYYYSLAKVLEKEYKFRFNSYNEISKYDFVSIFSIYKLLKEKFIW